MAVKNLGKVTITPKGEFNELTTYQKLDVVTYDGSSYLALQESTGNLPTDKTYFQEIAGKGADGDPGKDGKDGLNGTNGVDGKDGISVSSITQTTTSSESGGTNVITATLSDGTTSIFNIMNGKQGEQGIQGENGNWFIGDVDTGKPSRGETGAKGKTGEQGPQGIAGTNGTNGTDGQSATIQIGSVTTLEPGSSATVTNVGTETNAVFNFGIPKGEPGENATNSVTSTSINSIQVVDSLPDTEETGVLYLVKESNSEASAVSLSEEEPSVSTEEELSSSQEGA